MTILLRWIKAMAALFMFFIITQLLAAEVPISSSKEQTVIVQV
jgi:hypothetical protein